MRFFSALLFIFCLVFAPSAFAAQKQGVKAPVKEPANTPEKTPDKPGEKIYLESEVEIDAIYQFARDHDGISVSGTVQSFYPSGRLAWETQWMNGKLHGVTRGYYENRTIREETTWVNGKLSGPARWYDEKGNLLRETVHEAGDDPAASGETREQGVSAEQGEARDAPADQNKAPEESPK
jgi:hypothetical protein